MIDTQYIIITFKNPTDDVIISNIKNNAIPIANNVLISSFKFQRGYKNLYGSCDCTIILPTTDINLRNKTIDSCIEEKEIFIKTGYIKNNIKKESLIMNGIIENITVTLNTITINILDKTCVLNKTYIKPDLRIETNHYNSHFKQLLKLNNCLNLTDEIIDAKANSYIKRRGEIIPSYKQKLLTYIQTIQADLQIDLTTFYHNNKSYLYNLDTKSEANKLLNNEQILISNKTNNIIDYELSLNYQHSYNKIMITTKSSMLDNLEGSVMIYEDNQFKNQDLQYLKGNDDFKTLYTIKLKSDINKTDMENHARYLLRKQLQNGLNFTMKFHGVYFKSYIDNQYYQYNILQYIIFDNSSNLLLSNDANVIFSNRMLKLNVGSFEITYNESGLQTKLDIVPETFIFN